MSKKWITANVLLLAVAGTLAWRLSVSFKRFNTLNDVAQIQPVPETPRGSASDKGLPPHRPPYRYNAGDFADIPNQNIFAESRNNQKEEVKAAAVPDVPDLKVKPALVGVILFGDQRSAIIVQPGQATATSTNRRGQIKKLGDLYEGYTIVDITEDKMILENGPKREIISLFDSAKQRGMTAKTPLIATRIVNFGASQAANTPMVISSPGAPPRPVGAPTNTPSVAVIGGSLQAAPNSAAAGVRAPTGPQPFTPANPRGIDTQTNRQVISTPMGEFVTYPP